MANTFNAAKSLGAMDKVLERRHNELIDILQVQLQMLRAEVANGLIVTNGVLSLDLASALKSGGLSAADWMIFNGKQDALTFGIADNNTVQMDDVDAVTGQIARFTANGLEGVSTGDLLAEVNGSDLQARMDYVLEGYPTSLMTRFDTLVNGA